MKSIVRKKKSYNTRFLVISTVLLTVFSSAGEAAANQPNETFSAKKNTHTATIVDEYAGKISKIEKPKPLLTAESAPVQRNIKLIDSLTLEQELKEEEFLYPADDIYQSWNTTNVDPYGSLNMPDSYTIDLADVSMPIDNPSILVTSPFGPRRRRMHKGIDLKVQIGDTIRAAWDGKIRVQRFEKGGYGNFLIVRHPNGLETVYGHLSAFLVEPDQHVRAGDPIALGGNTGRSTGPHLHFETRFFGEAINPAEIFDFNNKVTHEDVYVFNKVKAPANKYTGKGATKIVYHRVKTGDTLNSIARKYGLTVGQLCKLNQLTSKTKIHTGKTLRCS